ncbi:hypothetical protein M758_12G021200 [Ceratodon purpureus]|uniref:Uncharacterized protein n=1 Tax=Ceratodon purpureus TaxID=3225 RepID=A0A8T0G8F7_CERPU|nr:hypothetical protein KC19_12G020900 [Ceratodon purpureus]KAG0597801.1 hypothetical protein M758_12G021200 [Ceratodon purpureus]
MCGMMVTTCIQLHVVVHVLANMCWKFRVAFGASQLSCPEALASRTYLAG